MTIMISEAGLARIFHDDIAPTQFGSLTPRPHPTAVFISGPPGSGTHSLTAQTQQAISQISRAEPAVINPVFLEPYHPRYIAPTPSGHNVEPDVLAAGRTWARMAADTVLQLRADAILEMPTDDPSATAATITRFRQAGYYVGISLISVPDVVSRLGTFNEFHHQLTYTGAGQLTGRTEHDNAHHGLLTLAELVEQNHLVDQAQVHGRTGLIASNYLTDDSTWHWTDTSITQAVIDERTRNWYPREQQQFIHLAQRLNHALNGRWHPELQELMTTAATTAKPAPQAFPTIRSGFVTQAANQPAPAPPTTPHRAQPQNHR